MCLHVQEAEIYHSPTSTESPEKIYASPSGEWYSEYPLRKSLLPASAKKFKDNIEALSSHSSDPKFYDWDPIGKPDEIAAWCAEYERGQKREMAKCSRLGIEGIHQVLLLLQAHSSLQSLKNSWQKS